MRSTSAFSSDIESVYADMRKQAEAMAKERAKAKRERLAEKLARSVPERYRAAHIDNDVCAEWLKAYEAGERRNLVMIGPNGTHKTTNAYALFTALMKRGVNCTFDTMGGHLRFIRSAYDGRMTEEDAMDALCSVPVLFIDDICKERGTEWAAGQVFEIFDARAAKRLPIVVTTNVGSTEIAKHYGEPGQAIVSRMAGGAMVAKFAGEDSRLHGTKI